MANDNTIRTYSAIDIEKYHNGQLSAREMHAMEKAALDDPFLADALEGYMVPGVNATADIAELKKRLEERTSRNKVIPIVPVNKSSFPWLRAAAMFVLVAGAAFLVYKFGFNSTDENNIAKGNPVVAKKDAAQQQDDKSISNTTDSSGSEVGQSSDYLIPEKGLTADSNAQGLVARSKDVDGDGVRDSYDTKDVASDSLIINNNRKNYRRADVTDYISTEREKVNDRTQYSWSSPSKKDTALFHDFKQSDEAAAKTDLARQSSVPATDKPKNLTARGNAQKKEFAASMAPPPLNVFRGRVTDASDNALPFANITNTADNVGTYSDSKGNFTLISPDSVLNVQVRSVGFENNTKLLVAGPKDNQIVMQEDNRSLGEVVIGNSQNANINRSRNNTIVHEEPEPVDGWSNYDIYVANNLNIPDTLKSIPSRRGEVELSFDVNKNGEPINITVDKSLCESCDKEAIRLLKEGPKWKQKNKRKKRTSVTISF